MRRLVRRRRDESGVIAIIVAVLAVVLLMSAAFAVDISMQINRKHQLHDTLDSAAQAGAFELPGNTGNAQTAALNFAQVHDPSETGDLAPNVDFWCIVASKKVGTVWQVETAQIPSTCYPGTSPYTVNVDYKATGRKISCSQVICAIPCVQPTPNTGTPKIACNTIRVFQGRDVPFAFAPAGGIEKGSTGSLVSVACKGSCGSIAPNPMDVAVVADRTNSMGATDVAKLRDGIRGMLQQMTPSQQYVALGTIGRSGQNTTALAASRSCSSSQRGLTYGSSDGATGLWMPIAFSDDYHNGTGALSAGSTLVKGVDCLTNMSDVYQGTVLASPMKAAAKYLLGDTPNNLGSLPEREPTPQKVLIFETDGQPNEREPTGGTTALASGDVFSHPLSTTTPVTTTQPTVTTGPVQTTSGGTTTRTTTITHNKLVSSTFNGGNNACSNLLSVAANAKARNILVIMIGYNMFENGQPKRCNDYDGVKDDYSNLNISSPRDSSVATSASDTVQNSSTTVNCTSPHVGKKCRTIVQTKTTTTVSEASTSATVLDVLAQAASPTRIVDGVGGDPSVAQNDCSTDALRAAENSDGDFLFCAASGTDMAPIFTTALSQTTKGIKLMRMP